ncbi:hypothetical protein G210_5890, partial [Candida maltosa Xu316]
MPNVPRDSYQEHQTERIPGSKFFDLDKYVGVSTYPHMLPSVNVMKGAFRDLDISKNDSLVVYDKLGIFSSPRAAFTFSLFGHPKVYLLDSYLGYKQASYPLDESPVQQVEESVNEEREVSLSEEEFEENYKRQVIDYEELLELVGEGAIGKDYLLLDARSLGRFTGEANEPRPGLSSGHVPGAVNLPFGELLDESTGNQYKSKAEITKIFEDRVGDLTELAAKYPKGIIVMCGTGVTAVILKFAIECILKLNVPVRVYDGSWTEWASRAPEEFIKKDI